MEAIRLLFFYSTVWTLRDAVDQENPESCCNKDRGEKGLSQSVILGGI